LPGSDRSAHARWIRGISSRTFSRTATACGGNSAPALVARASWFRLPATPARTRDTVINSTTASRRCVEVTPEPAVVAASTSSRGTLTPAASANRTSTASSATVTFTWWATRRPPGVFARRRRPSTPPATATTALPCPATPDTQPSAATPPAGTPPTLPRRGRRAPARHGSWLCQPHILLPPFWLSLA